MNDIELYEDILKGMLDLTENGDLFREEMDDRLLIGELDFLVMIIKNLLDTIPEKRSWLMIYTEDYKRGWLIKMFHLLIGIGIGILRLLSEGE